MDRKRPMLESTASLRWNYPTGSKGQDDEIITRSQQLHP